MLAFIDVIGIARGCTTALGTCTPRTKKFFAAKFTGESCKCTPGRGRVFLEETGEVWMVRVVNLVVIAYVLRVHDD